MKTKKPTSRTVDKWTRSPEEIFREHGLTIKWGNKIGGCVYTSPKPSISSSKNNLQSIGKGK